MGDFLVSRVFGAAYNRLRLWRAESRQWIFGGGKEFSRRVFGEDVQPQACPDSLLNYSAFTDLRTVSVLPIVHQSSCLYQ